MRSFLVCLCSMLIACGGDAPPPPECNGTSCSCPAGETCEIGDSGCAGNSCSLDCIADNDCRGECGSSCSIDCSGGSVCDVVVGASSSVSCSDATCTVRCLDTCSLSCGASSTCRLQCAGDSAPRDVVEGGQCP